MSKSYDELVASDPADVASRFWPRVVKAGDGECWEWQGFRNPLGYGAFQRGRHMPQKAHRVSFWLTFGWVPARPLELMHTCDNPPCINPAHLVLGTQGDNIADRDAKGRHRPGRMLGEAHPAARLNDGLVLSIRELHAEGAPIKDIAAEYGVHYGTVYQIVTRRTWKHLPKRSAA